MEEISINRPFLSLSAERWISLGCGAGNCGCLNRADMVSFARTLADLHGGHVPGFACGRNAACIQWRCDAGLRGDAGGLYLLNDWRMALAMSLPVGPSIASKSHKSTSTPASRSRDRNATDRVRRFSLAATSLARCRHIRRQTACPRAPTPAAPPASPAGPP